MSKQNHWLLILATLSGGSDTANVPDEEVRPEVVGVDLTSFGATPPKATTAMIFGTDDEETPPDPNAVFLWITDLPDLNTQTREKMCATSSRLGSDRLRVIENSFDEAFLEPGPSVFRQHPEASRERHAQPISL